MKTTAARRHQTSFIRRFRKVAIAFATIAVVLLAITLWASPRQLQPDEVIRECGSFVSPHRRTRVVVTESGDGMITVARILPDEDVLKTLWRRHVRPLQGRKVPGETTFEAEREWFLCFDQYDRLWMFVGHWNADWGPRRESSLGHMRSNKQGVSVSGFFLEPSGSLRSGTSSVGDLRTWKGVPSGFFELIPGKDDAALWWEFVSIPLPATPPEFTPEEWAAAKSFYR